MIPKTIHFCWLSDEPYPDRVRECIASWQRHLPEYELVLWDLARSPSVPWVDEAYENRKFAFAADYIRFYALYHYGGIYLDSDVEVLQSFDALLSNKSFIGYDALGDIEAAVIGAEKGVDWVGRCLEKYRDKHFVDKDGRLDTVSTVPLLVDDVLYSYYGLVCRDRSIHQSFGSLEVFPYYYFSPKNLFTRRYDINENTICIHHFEGKWVDETPLRKLKRFCHKLIILVFGNRVHRALTKARRKR